MARPGQNDVYQTHVQPHLQDIKEWYKTMTLGQIAQKLGIHRATLHKYMNFYPELEAALTDGRNALVEDLRCAIKKRALGYDVEEVTIKETESDEKGYTKTTTTTTRHIPPDLGSAHLLLKNLDPTWHDADAVTIKQREKELKIKQQKADASEW